MQWDSYCTNQTLKFFRVISSSGSNIMMVTD